MGTKNPHSPTIFFQQKIWLPSYNPWQTPNPLQLEHLNSSNNVRSFYKKKFLKFYYAEYIMIG